MEESRKYVCVLSTDNYIDGVLILYENLKHINSSHSLLCLVNETISERNIKLLINYGIEIKKINKVNHLTTNFYWKNTFDKLNIFSLVEYEKIVYLDVDVLILENIDSLFDYPTPSMCYDRPWFNDRFNSGIMVITPNTSDYEQLLKLNDEQTANIGDQDLLNKYFKGKINPLPDNYNIMRTLTDEKNAITTIFHPVGKYINPEPDDIKILHYIRHLKPFMINTLYNEVDSYLYSYYFQKAKIKKEKILREIHNLSL